LLLVYMKFGKIEVVGRLQIEGKKLNENVASLTVVIFVFCIHH